MNNRSYLLDTSALLTWIEGEEGFLRVRSILDEERTIIPWAALFEVYHITLQERGEIIAYQRYATLMRLPVTFIWEMSESVVLTAGRLKAKHRISFADATIAAIAVHTNAILVHKDPEFVPLSGVILLEALPFKTN